MEPAVAGGYRRVRGGLPASTPASKSLPGPTRSSSSVRAVLVCVAGDVDGREGDVSQETGFCTLGAKKTDTLCQNPRRKYFMGSITETFFIWGSQKRHIVRYSGSSVYGVLMSTLWNESVLYHFWLVTSNKYSPWHLFFATMVVENIPVSVTVIKAVPSTGFGFLIFSMLASSQEWRNREIFLSAERFKARLKCALDRLH